LASTSTHTPHHIVSSSSKITYPIYSYIRELEGIVGYKTSPDPPAQASAMGAHADKYFLAHSYLTGTVQLIQRVYEEADGVNTFVDRLSGQGVPIMEAQYIHTLIYND
jgi:hypothetical protein